MDFRYGPGERVDSRQDDRPRTAATALVEQLKAQGVEHVFCVPGESYLAVLDALYDSGVQVTVCRNEGGAAMMADALGRATGRPGVCFVTRGPGATNASGGIHISRQDSTPVVMFVGQVEQAVRGREAFQELDYAAVFGSMTKWAGELDDAERVTEFTARAFNLAAAGRPGPVVLALPKDVLTRPCHAAVVRPTGPVETAPGHAEMGQLAGLLASAERPLLLLGGPRWSEAACAAVVRFSERTGIAVATTYRRSPLFDPLHPNYAGDLGLAPNPRLLARAKEADLLVAIGTRLSEITSQGYSLFDAIPAHTRLVHAYPDPEELGRVFAPRLAIHATPSRLAEALDQLEVEVRSAWTEQGAAAHADYLQWSDQATAMPGDVNLGEVMIWLRGRLPVDAIVCNGAGAYAGWIHRFYRFRRFATQIAPTCASMGYGVPAAVAMKRLHPERTVVSINGDGDFLMNGQEFATAVQYDLPIVVLVFDNASYGAIRMHQEREYPGRVMATDLKNPDFAAYARAFGGFGATVERTDEFTPAFEAALASGMPSILHVKFDQDAIGPSTTLSGIRAKALNAG